jgi:hypothetical protein
LQTDVKSAISLDINSKEVEMINQFKQSENYKNYKFNIEELEKIKIDLTFLEVKFKNNCDIESPSQQAVEYVKNSLICFPEIKPLLHVLKRFLQVEKLNSSFNGIK